MNKLLVLMLTASAVFAAPSANAGRDAGQMQLQDKWNREAAARRQCEAQAVQALDHGPRAQVPPRIPATTEKSGATTAEPKEEIAVCVASILKKPL